MLIKVETIDKYTGDEDHIEEALKCEFCDTGMEGEKELEKHFGKRGMVSITGVGVKQAMEMVRMAESGERKHVCKVCGKGFKTKEQLSAHGPTHTKIKAFVCDVEGCDKKFTAFYGLCLHKKTRGNILRVS